MSPTFRECLPCGIPTLRCVHGRPEDRLLNRPCRLSVVRVRVSTIPAGDVIGRAPEARIHYLRQDRLSLPRVVHPMTKDRGTRSDCKVGSLALPSDRASDPSDGVEVLRVEATDYVSAYTRRMALPTTTVSFPALARVPSVALGIGSKP